MSQSRGWACIVAACALICIPWASRLNGFPQPGLGQLSRSPAQKNVKLSIIDPPIILSDSSGEGLKEYVRQITERIRTNWASVIPQDALNGKKGRLSLIYVIGKDGSLTDVETACSTRLVSLNQAGISAIRASGPFPPFPDDVSGDHLTLQTTFLYNLKPTDSAANAMDAVAHLAVPAMPVLQGTGALAPVDTYILPPTETEKMPKGKSEGTVTLSVLIDEKGSVAEVEDVKPLGHGLDEKAIQKVRDWKFRPATSNHMPVPARVLLVITFRLS
jgi:TonB family protein